MRGDRERSGFLERTQGTERRMGQGTLCALLFCSSCLVLFIHRIVAEEGQEEIQSKRERITLFMAISSKFDYVHRRMMLRSGWLQWVNIVNNNITNNNTRRGEGRVEYRFFTDYPLTPNEWDFYDKESSVNPDLVFLPPDQPRGHNLEYYFPRGMFHITWALRHFEPDYYLRLDDDGFLCLHKLHYDLTHHYYPSERFFMGKYHCVNRGREGPMKTSC